MLAVLMLAGEATVQVAAIDSNGNGTTKTVSYVATHNYTVYYLDLKGMCYIMRDKGIDVGVSYGPYLLGKLTNRCSAVGISPQPVGN